MSTLAIAEVTTSTRTDITFLTSVQKLRAVTLCSAFAPICGNDNITSNPLGDVFCPNTKCSGKLCLHKKILNLSAEAIINVRNARLYVLGAQYSFWKSNKFLFLDVWRRDLQFRRGAKMISICYWRCVWSKMPKRKVCWPFNQQNFQFLLRQKVQGRHSCAD